MKQQAISLSFVEILMRHIVFRHVGFFSTLSLKVNKKPYQNDEAEWSRLIIGFWLSLLVETIWIQFVGRVC